MASRGSEGEERKSKSRLSRSLSATRNFFKKNILKAILNLTPPLKNRLTITVEKDGRIEQKGKRDQIIEIIAIEGREIDRRV